MTITKPTKRALEMLVLWVSCRGGEGTGGGGGGGGVNEQDTAPWHA
jgi:hypothetical protein